MKLTVGKALKPQAVPNSYSVEVSVMAGDADYYDNFTVHGFEPGRDEGLLEELLRLFDRIDAYYPHGRGGSEEYTLRNVPGFEAWFGESGFEDLEEEDRSKEYETLVQGVDEFRKRVDDFSLKGVSFPYWPMDAMTDYTIECDYDSHKIFYYDENLVKHEVSVER